MSPPRFASLLLLVGAVFAPTTAAFAAHPFTIVVQDERTGRGVPLVELTTLNVISHVTDSNGVIAFNEPGLMGERVFFNVRGHGYAYPADAAGVRGVTLDVKPGGKAELKIKRINIAERLYRVTGQGIYRDSTLAGIAAPTSQPLLNGGVLGQDSVLADIYRDRIFWLFGDTLGTAGGQWAMSGATSRLPGDGGLDPSVGIDLNYFVDEQGFSRKMAPLPGEGAIWLTGLTPVNDPDGNRRLVAHYLRVKSLTETLERGLVLYDDNRKQFEKILMMDLGAPLCPFYYPFRVRADEGGTPQDYFYYPAPYPCIRIKADMKHLTDPASYEGFTCLEPGARWDPKHPRIERDAQGKPVFGWKRDTGLVLPKEMEELIRAGTIHRADVPFRLADATTGDPLTLWCGSVYWNDFRKKYIMIAAQWGGTSPSGEIWFAESAAPEGPWTRAIKIVTHDNYSFYNPVQLPFFDQDGGRVIYFMGTYSTSYTSNTNYTPRYEYNQIMYRLDLADERLRALE